MNIKARFYFWWRYSDNPIASLYREYHKFRMKATRAKDTNFKYIHNTLLYIATRLYCYITYPYVCYLLYKREQLDKPLQVTPEMIETKISALNKFYKTKN